MIWTNIDSCNALMIRIRFLETKQKQYLATYISAFRNNTLTTFNQLLVNSSTTFALALTGVQKQAVIDAINATRFLRANLDDYMKQLIFSIGRMGRMAADIRGSGDTYCSCDIPGLTTTTTTETTTTTDTTTTEITTTISQCGEIFHTPFSLFLLHPFPHPFLLHPFSHPLFIPHA